MWAAQFHARRENLLVVLATGLFAAALCFVAPTLLDSMDYLVLDLPLFLQGRRQTVLAADFPAHDYRFWTDLVAVHQQRLNQNYTKPQ
jgi:hypothetical protein